MDTSTATPVASSAANSRPVHTPKGSVTKRLSHLLHRESGDLERARIESFIASEFRKHFSADITEFMPSLAGLYDDVGNLKAAVGYRPAAAGPLFLECYTMSPIEAVLCRQMGETVPRKEIVEVGGLACTGGRAAMEIVAALVPALIEAGFSWVVFTGADTVRNVFRRLSLRPVALCIANKSLLGERQHDWGTYYEHNPVVMAGRLADGLIALESAAGAR